MKLGWATWTAFLLLAGAGCGKPVLRLADASLGDYYTDKEFKKLTEEQRAEYCQDLADQRETYESEIADAREALGSLQLGTPARLAEIDSLQSVAASLEARLASLSQGAAPPAASKDHAGAAAGSAPKHGNLETYVVKRGDSLWRISGLAELYGRPTEWGRLFEANRDRISNPDRIYPGQELKIPR